MVNLILERISSRFPDASCELNYSSTFELLVAVILSAQCTDKRVNIITDKLFKVYNTPQQFACLTPEQLIPFIRSAGFFNNKAANIIKASRDIVERFDGDVPSEIDQLVTLAGVGRKTANVVHAVGFGGEAIAVDTHVFRVSRRLGLANASSPEGVERQLRQVLPENRYSEGHHLILFLGRYICKARKPDCAECPVSDMCPSFMEVL